MGLTISYQLRATRPFKAAEVRAFFEPLREQAIARGCAEVTPMMPLGPDSTLFYYRPRVCKRASDFRLPVAGWVFGATPGDGCETAFFGLCRFPGVKGWRLDAFCKTQYAACHGWEHFRKCHRIVTELLWLTKEAGMGVTVNDEGGVFDGGGDSALRRSLEEYERPMAAFAGALKDAGMLGTNAACPILDHPQFEHLEAAGVATHGDAARRAMQIVRVFAAGGDRDGA